MLLLNTPNFWPDGFGQWSPTISDHDPQGPNGCHAVRAVVDHGVRSQALEGPGDRAAHERTDRGRVSGSASRALVFAQDLMIMQRNLTFQQ